MKFRDIQIPFAATDAIRTEVENGRLVSGPYVEKMEEQMRTLGAAHHAVAVSSGTMALKIALDAIGVGPRDLVVVPDITFIACATVVMELGAKPIFVDVRPDNQLMEFEDTASMVAGNRAGIKAIMAVRLGGEPLPDWIFELGVPVIIDSAHSMDAHDPRAAATCYSFYPTKIVTGMEGGCIVTNSPEIAEQAKQLRLFGFLPGKRVSNMLGYKGNMTNVSACLISFNLARLGANLGARRAFRDRLNALLGLQKRGLGMYMVTVEDPDWVCARIPAIRHYPQTLSMQVGGVSVNKYARWVAEHLVSIPFHEHLVDGEVEEVCDTVKNKLITYSDQHGAQQGSGGV